LFQIYVQAEASARINADSLKTLQVRDSGAPWRRLALWPTSEPSPAPRSSALTIFVPRRRSSQTRRKAIVREGLTVLQEIAKSRLRPGARHQWTAMSYQEEEGRLCVSLLLVHLILAVGYIRCLNIENVDRLF
jgi:HAE1 family hydrophobic/amphiphilic exporter-1